MMKTRILVSVAAALAAGMAVLAAPIQADSIPGAPWIQQAERQGIAKAFDPVEVGISNRPSVLTETNYYVYGPGTGFSEVEVDVTLRSQGFDDPVNIYLYWQNRNNTAQTLYYNLPSGDFVNTEVDLFGTPGNPVDVRTPDLGTPGGEPFALFGPNSAFGPVPASVSTATGLYQFVLEIRRPNGSVVSRGNALYNWVDGVQVVSGNQNGTVNWTANNAYYLADPVNFQSGSTLNIQAGTVILGSEAGQGTLVIRQGAQIFANGSDMAPIIFTSEQEVGSREPGNWGGLVINGSAPTNEGVVPNGEGDSGPYGGDNAADNSGTLRFVRVEFAGIRFSETNELNGIALQGVGSGTTLEYLQVHFNSDDGIEFFGGSANAKYVLITDAEDDSVDWVQGWDGKMQYVVVTQRTGVANRLIEADNLSSNPDALPRSAPMIANGTFYGNLGTPNVVERAEGIRLRLGTGGNLTHLIQANAKEEGIRVTDAETLAILGTELQIRNSWFVGNGSGLTDDPTVQGYLEAGAQGNSFGNPQIPNGNDIVAPDFAIRGNGARNNGPLPAEFQSDPFFDNVNFAGGVNPFDSWTDDGWTTFSDN